MAETNSAIITLFVAAITGGSTLAGVWLSNRNSREQLKLQLSEHRDKDKETTIRAKAEELYELTDAWLKALGSNYLYVAGVMQGKLTYNQCLDLQITQGDKCAYKFSKIEMLLEIYFPKIKPSYEKVLEVRTAINSIVADHKRSYETGDLDGKKFLEPYFKAQELLEQYGEEFKSIIAECARNA